MPLGKTVEFVKNSLKNTILPLNRLANLYPDSEDLMTIVRNINDITDLCNFEKGTFNLDKKIFNLEACILEVMNMYPEKEYALEMSDIIPDFIEGYRDSLKHLIILIVRNSNKKITIKIKACKYYKNKQLKILIEVCNINHLSNNSVDRFMIDNIINTLNGDFWEEECQKCFSLYISFSSLGEPGQNLNKEKFRVAIVINDTERRLKLCKLIKNLEITFAPFSSEEEYFLTPLTFVPDIIFSDKESKKIEGALINSRIFYIVDNHILENIKENVSFIKFPINEKKLETIMEETFFHEKPKIIIDEDNYINRIILMSIFRKLDIEVKCSYNDNKKFLDNIKNYDVCFVDTKKKLVERIKMSNPCIKIIGVTSDDPINFSGYDSILKRPISMHDILSISIV